MGSVTKGSIQNKRVTWRSLNRDFLGDRLIDNIYLDREPILDLFDTMQASGLY
ncbi:hypothetical protein PI95_016240 [Hassallia byssoidea VB512170]|uniref:Uncharacterized protein n=1 Tax=Hassallia byssoidea VB512170 TaxID=1304833 RepID=A0A846HBJ8_9CYAN|nr:hypothetical protein [Hassalia byssoidea]NEU74064.1 hypothetical protein [Hassalia byssoidea VB512170]